MNEEDSEKISGMLKAMAHEKTDFRDNADIIIFNTCCVRENAEFKVHGNLGNLKKLKRKQTELIIAVCGCMMQQAGVAEGILKIPTRGYCLRNLMPGNSPNIWNA